MEDTTVLDQGVSAVETAANTEIEAASEQPAVIEQPTDMDNNVTYENLPKEEIQFDPSKSYEQNMVNNAVRMNYDNQLDSNTGKSINKFLTQDYNYNPEEAGSYWVAGAINDKDTQMSFLESLIYEEMYDDMELQKYYYDQTMATARAYAASKDRETAYGYYRAAQEKAIAEAQLTGWYMPAEGQYMLTNYICAQGKLDDPDASPEEKAKAKRVTSVAEKWFGANNISTRGMKCLSLMNYEEKVRHNKANERLQGQANNIAAAGNDINAALANINLRNTIFNIEEEEMASGHNYTKELGIDELEGLKDVIGHDKSYKGYAGLQALESYDNITALLSDPTYYQDVYTARGKNWVDQVLRDNGKDPQVYYEKYRTDLGDKFLKDSFESNGNMIPDSALDDSNNFVISSKESNDKGAGKKIYTFKSTNDDGTLATRCYWKDDDGVFHQITENIELKDGSTISEKVQNFDYTPLRYEGVEMFVGDIKNLQKMSGSYSSNLESYSWISDKAKQTIQAYERQGYQVVDGGYSTNNLNTGIIMKHEEDGVVKYYEVEGSGDFHELTDQSKTRLITIKGNVGDTVINNGTYDKSLIKEVDLNGKEHQNDFGSNWHADTLKQQFRTIGENVYLYVNPDGSTVYLQGGNGNFKIISKQVASEMSNKSISQIDKIVNDKSYYTNNYTPAKETDKIKDSAYTAFTSNGNTISLKESEYKQYMAEYEEYVRREKESPSQDVLPFRDWLEGRTSINDVKEG